MGRRHLNQLKWFKYIGMVVCIVLLVTFVININRIRERFDTNPKVCFITGIYGNYEQSCKPYVSQTIPTDFICFTDNSNITNNGWIIDNTPYHITNPSPIDDGTYINSLQKNTHTFNIAKYYKQCFQNIPRLKNYDIIIWIDGTIEIIYDNTSKWVSENIQKSKIITWEHEGRSGILKNEVDASNFDRYTSTFWNNQSQPYQDIFTQYNDYVKNGFVEGWCKTKTDSNRQNLGVWLTCFVAFDNTNHFTNDFLNEWYLQTLKYTTQDQIGFPYVCQKMKFIPYTLPDETITGDSPHDKTQFYIKHTHGK